MALRSTFLFLLVSVTARAGEPWEKPFAGDPAVIARTAAQAPKSGDPGVTVLLEEEHVSYDADGRATERYRQVYRIEKQTAIEGWGQWAAGWSPWYQERPVIRARVIGLDGTVREFSPATIEERSRGGAGPDMFSDGKLLRAPLPGLLVGAVVEAENLTVDRVPSFDAGTVRRYYMMNSVPTRSSRLVIDAPASLPLAYQTFGLGALKPKRESRAGRVTWTFERGPLAAADPPEVGSTEPWARVVFATGRSWAQVAARYGKLVDEAIAGSDVTGLAREARGDAQGRDAIAARLLARLHQDVRYTGVELAEASIVPRSPAETLRRKFGDCKDQATLLVALLRASGIPAYVALLRVNPYTSDVAPSLPGMDFDHAIVVAPGKPDLWIDPTHRYARAGELPLGDQDRLALVARDGVTGLQSTPARSARQNRIVEQRTVILPEQGEARITEDTTASGDFELDYRQHYTDLEPKKLREQLTDYVKRIYRSDTLDEQRHTDPAAIDQPFTLHLVMNQSIRGQTLEDHAEVALFPGDVLHELTQALRSKPEHDPARRTGFRLYRPMRAEQHVRIVPPPGYSATELPPNEKIDVGPWHIDLSYTKSADGEVRADLTFETDKTVLSAAEFETVRDKVVELEKQDGRLLRLENVAQMHLLAGRLKEGVAELTRLAALHPKEAIHQVRLSEALLKAGLGEPARDAARRATILEPASGVAWNALGHALEHDLLGRLHAPGWDYAGAEAALRKAKALAPKMLSPRYSLAVVMEYDSGVGERYAKKARLAEAANEYRALRKDLDDKTADMNLLVLLMRMGRTDELIAFAKEMEPSTKRDGVVCTSLAMARGPDAALKEAALRATDRAQRAEILSVTAATLLELRRYGDALAISRRAREFGATQGIWTQMEALAKVRPREETKLRDDDPAALVRGFYADLFAARTAEALKIYFTDAVDAKEMEHLWFVSQRVKLSLPLAGAILSDALMALTEAHVDGDAKAGWRVHVANAMGAGGSDTYVIATPRGLRIAGTSPAELGELALGALERHDTESARRWLTWARADAKGSDAAALATLGAQSGPVDLEAVAALLASSGPHGTNAEAALLRCAAARVEPRSTDCWKADVAIRVRSGNPAKVLATLERVLTTTQADWIEGYVHRATLLLALGRKSDAAQVAAELQRRWPADDTALRAAAQVAGHAGDCDGARRILRKLIDGGRIDAAGLNDYAWCAIAAGRTSDDDLEAARRSVDESKRLQRAALNTLALVAAERGQLELARDVLRESLPAGASVSEADWLVIGRLSETYGLGEAARRAYTRVAKPSMPAGDDVWTLAQQRLAAMAPATSR